MRAHQTLAAACVIGLCALSSPARAQSAAAKELLSQGLSEMAATHYDKACPAIEQSYKIDARPATLLILAECEGKRGRLSVAVARYDEYLALSPKQKKPADQKAAKDARAAIVAQMPQLTLSLPSGAPAGTVVKRDGDTLDAAKLGSAQPVDPGEHVVTTQPPGGQATELKVTLAKGDKKQITLAVKGTSAAPSSAASKPGEASKPAEASKPGEASKPADTAGPTAPPPPSTPPSPRRTAIYVSGAVGIVGLVLGTVTGAVAVSKKSVIVANCGAASGFPGDPKGCNDFGVSTLNTAKALALTSTIGLAVGAAGVITAGVLWLTAPKRAAHAQRGVEVGVLSAGSQGGTIGIQGAW